MSSIEKKVYDYKAEPVRDQLLDVFRKRKGEATVADLVALTGLPKNQVETEVKAVGDEYGARLRVTESGEILYSFPSGMRSRYRGFMPSLKRFWKTFRKGAATVGSFLFKIWILGMLVGYFVLFLALALMAMLASMAVSASGKGDSRDDRRGGGLGGFMIAGRLLDSIVRIWFYSELFKDPRERAYQRDRKRQKKPLYKAIFSFVFGDGDPDEGWDAIERKAVIAFAQANRGVVTLPEFMAITGLPPLQAEDRINRYLYEFEGSPEVSEGGSLYYFFPALLRSGNKAAGGSASFLTKGLASFSSNPKKANVWFCAINAANLLFGSYFLYNAVTIGIPQTVRGFDYLYAFTAVLLARFAGIPNPVPLIAVGLGVVPLAFAALFYAIPALRARALAARNERVKLENLRRATCRAILASPGSVRPEALPLTDEAARPKDPRGAERVVNELAAWAGAEPAADGSFDFAEVARSKAEAAKVRSAVNPADYELGGTVFDSHS